MALSLAHVLRSVAARRPDAEALVQVDRRVRYGELWQTVAAVAGFLQQRKLAPGQRVALLLDNGPEYVAAYYGVLAVGGAVVGLNAAAKARDLVTWLRHSEADWLFAATDHPALAEVRAQMPANCKLVLAGGGDDAAACWEDVLAAEPLLSLAAPETEALAQIIYTSGTTGQPKGVMLSHGNLLSNVQAVVGYLNLHESDRVLHVLPFYYSYGNSVLHTHLAAGAALVVQTNLIYPHRVLETMVEERVTGFCGVPATFSLLLSRTRLENYDLAALRYVTQAGGAMAPSLIQRWRSLLPHADFFVMYGQTEATARLAYLPPERLTQKLGSAGLPLPGTEIRVLDEAGQALPAGSLGEICARGPHVMLGYWNDPAATARVLHDGWLHTGDLGFLDEEGFIYIEGRSSEMIKTGAHRVSPREIEEVVLELDGVVEAAAVGMADEIMGQLIKLIVVPEPGREIDPRSILAHCRQQLPPYKIPKFIEVQPELPKTASGKIKRYQL
jgi:long-chain acyl-CoA synthetase